MGKLWNFFRFSLLFLAVLFPTLSANATTEDTKLNLSLKNANLPTIFKEIKNQTKYDFMYNPKEIDVNKTISVNVKNVSLDSALKVCLSPFGLTYTMKDKIIILKKMEEKGMECCHCHQKATPRSEKERKQLQNRLSRMSGQLNGISRMLEENRYCGDILTQVAAVESALQAFGYAILKEHMETCVVEEIRKGNTAIVDEAVELVKKLK